MDFSVHGKFFTEAPRDLSIVSLHELGGMGHAALRIEVLPQWDHGQGQQGARVSSGFALWYFRIQAIFRSEEAGQSLFRV